MPPVTLLDIVTDAFLEPGIIEAGETLSAEDASFGLRKANRLFDTWNADDLFIFSTDFLQFLLIPNLQPLTIGQAFRITSVSVTSNLATYSARNQFQIGQAVDVAGCTTAALNVSNVQIVGATPDTFQVQIPGQPDIIEPEIGALAVFSGNAIPNFATATQRPAKILNANIILNNVTPNVKVPLRIRDDDWWSANSVPTTTTELPTDLYYSPGWPNGQIYLWPMQDTAYGLELECWTNLADIADLNYPFYLPQGYRDAITYTLAETLCPSYGKTISPELAAIAQRCRAMIRGLNSTSPTIMTRDLGLPSGTRSYFNWLNGAVMPGPK